MSDHQARGAVAGRSIVAEVRDFALGLVGVGFKPQLEEARSLLRVTRRGVESIRHTLNIALDLVNTLRRASDGEKQEILERYSALLTSIDQKANGAVHEECSLIDESDYKLELEQKGRAAWRLDFDHVNLTVGANGLGLPKVSELDNRDLLCDEAQARLAGAIGQTNQVLKEVRERVVDIEDKMAGVDHSAQKSQMQLKDDAKESAIEIAKIVVMALAIALVFRSFLFQPFHIPSGSMKPTLLTGDYLFVSKYSYGYSNKSFPFGVSFLNGRVFHREPKRGDVIVFKLTKDGRTDYIKRLVGLPGDKLQVLGGVLHINDVAVPKVASGEYFYTEDKTGNQYNVSQHAETLPNGVIHNTLDLSSIGRNDNTGIYRVPEGHYFFMGDNRDDSQDSRVVGGGVGFVPAENLIGRAEIIFISVDGSARLWQIWKWPSAIRYSRVMKSIQ